MASIMGIIGLAQRAGKIESGDDAVRRTIEHKRACLVILAGNAADRTKENFLYLAREAGIPIIIYADKNSLGRAIGKQERSVLAITDSNFRQGIVKAYERGELFGK